MSTETEGRTGQDTANPQVLLYPETRPRYIVETGAGSLRETWMDPRTLNDRTRKTRHLNGAGEASKGIARDLTVLEKLQLGVLASLAQQPPDPQLGPPPSQGEQPQKHSPGPSDMAAPQEPTTIIGLQRAIDAEFGLEEFTHLHIGDRAMLESDKPPTVILPSTAQREVDETPKEELEEHYQIREGFA